jgi:MYXO-CTERM domain-containing protein
MKNALLRFSITCALLVAGSVEAQITTINPASSYGTITFNDVNSLNPSLVPGSTYSQGSSPWTGAPVSLSQTDPTTLDVANGILDASGFGPSTYPILLNNITLTQPGGNTGYAQLNFQFGVQYQIGAGGLSAASVQYPNFLISGTVQPAVTSYASLSGSINYFAVNAAGVGSLVDTVNYNWLYNTPGTFSGVSVSGVPVNPILSAIGPNSTLVVTGSLTFVVDPASITVETVPEPASQALAFLALAGLAAVCRRRK